MHWIPPTSFGLEYFVTFLEERKPDRFKSQFEQTVLYKISKEKNYRKTQHKRTVSLTRHYSSSVLQPEILANNLIAKALSPFQGGKLV